MSQEISELTAQIKHNCNISDSQYWGYLSLCNMLFRMRELYFHEHGLRPWEKTEKDKVGAWISERESLWETLEENPLQPLNFAGSSHDAFDLDIINKLVQKHGLVYGAGYGVLNKPNFFLAELEKQETLHDTDIYYLGREICHDLTPHVAMHQNGKVFVRRETFENFLFQKFTELKKEFHADTLRSGFEYYKIPTREFPENPRATFASLAENLLPLLVWHEIGEANETPDDQELWLEMLASSDNKLTEIRLRGIKDVLADNSPRGTMNYIIQTRDRGALYFHLSLIDEARKYAFPQIHQALEVFEKDSSWNILDQAREKLHEDARNIRNKTLELYRESKDILSVSAYLKNLFR